MGKIYKQSKVDLYIETNVNLSEVTSHTIQYLAPSGHKGRFTSTIESDNKTLSHFFQSGELSEEGTWTFWPYLIFNDGRDAYGEPIRMTVSKIGT